MPTFASTQIKEVLPVNGFPGENHLRDMQFKLSHNLQTTLDLHATLELFFSNIQEAVAVCGLEFKLPGGGKPIILGEKQPHSAKYNLSREKQAMGAVIFRRSKRFMEAELTILEMLTSVLYFPLRNALLYREALENSLRDPLTGIGNRAALDINFNRETKLSHRHNTPLSLAVIDIDYFKTINDNYGHRVGDKVIQHTVKSIQNTLRETDQIFRFGGEEFVVLLNNTPLASAKLTAERIRMYCAMTPYNHGNNLEVPITVSIGISSLKPKDTTESLFERADSGVFRAKASGRNKVVSITQDTG